MTSPLVDNYNDKCNVCSSLTLPTIETLWLNTLACFSGRPSKLPLYVKVVKLYKRNSVKYSMSTVPLPYVICDHLNI